jgi:3D (Asp-Asp-Asp) domain-containing protein
LVWQRWVSRGEVRLSETGRGKILQFGGYLLKNPPPFYLNKRVIRKLHSKEAVIAKFKNFIIPVVFLMLTFVPAPLQNKEQGRMQPSIAQPPEYKFQATDVEIPSRGKAGDQGREMTVESTAYCWTGYKTYSGTWPREGATVAVDNQKIKIGSKIFIKELNSWFVGEDLLPPESVAKGAKIDVYFNQEKDAWKWGRRDVRVVVEKP